MHDANGAMWWKQRLRRSPVRLTSMLPGLSVASWTATVESSQAATAIVAGATAGDDIPYLRTGTSTVVGPMATDRPRDSWE